MFNVTKCIAFLTMQALTIANIVDLDGMSRSSWSMYIVCLNVGRIHPRLRVLVLRLPQNIVTSHNMTIRFQCGLFH